MLCLITERKLCAEPLLERLEKLLGAGVPYLMLREKDLSGPELLSLSREAAGLATRHRARLIIHSSPTAAEAVGAWAVQLPFKVFRQGACARRPMKTGVSIHSREEALAAEKAGADYVLAGHIFETDCKKGLPGRGLDFLAELRHDLKIPVWAVGGVRPDNIGRVLGAGAAVACVRAPFMESQNPAQLAGEYLMAGRRPR